MAVENIKIEWYLHPEGDVTVRAIHDVPNGSAIRVHSKKLSEALEQLAQRIRATELADPVWQNDRVK